MHVKIIHMCVLFHSCGLVFLSLFVQVLFLKSSVLLKISLKQELIQYKQIKESLLQHPEGICVSEVGIRSAASRQRGAQREREFIVCVFKGLALLPKADRRPETWCQFLSFIYFILLYF